MASVRTPMEDRMATVETMATLDEHHQLQLDETLPITGPMRVKVIVSYPLSDESEAKSEPAGTGATLEVDEDLKRDPNYLAYEREQEALMSDHQGEYVAYCRGERVAMADSKKELFSLLDSEFPDKSCFIQHISRGLRNVTFRRPRRIMPSSGRGTNASH